MTTKTLVIDKDLDLAAKQYLQMCQSLHTPDDFPRSNYPDGNLQTCRAEWWASGFFPGSLWQLYSHTKNPELKTQAQKWTASLENQKTNTTTHDIGFMIFCSFGTGYRLTQDESYRDTLISAAHTLSARFRAKAGCIQSWGDINDPLHPVIIDNMMNLELLFWAAKVTGNKSFFSICTSHADQTIKNHYRKDYSAFHVVEYRARNGQVAAKRTAQGFSDSSTWARGQAWGLYGFAIAYRESRLERYLQHAIHIADFLLDHENMPKDAIPYWDFDYPEPAHTYRDASAAAIMASGLLELSTFVPHPKKQQYIDFSEKIINTLGQAPYRSKMGKNNHFLLKHSVGSLPHKKEVDAPLAYADYYYIEALLKYKKIILRN